MNSTSADIEVAISPDGLSLYFASNRPGGFGRQDLYVSTRATERDEWGEPTNLGAGINTAADDRTPMITADGKHLYFSSDRPGGVGLTDLYVMERGHKHDNADWGEPVNLGPSVNTEFSENLPFFFTEHEDDVGTLYFNSQGRPGAIGGTDIYTSERRHDGSYTAAVLVPELSSPLRDAGIAIRRDGLELIMTSDRAGTFGTFDLWVSTRASRDEPWSAPVNLGPVVNSAGGEARLSLSRDATTMYISADRAGTLGVQDLWVSTRSWPNQ